MELRIQRLTSKPRRFLVIAALAALDLFAALPAAAVSASLGKPEVAQKRVPTTTSVTIAPEQAELRRYSREPGTVILGDVDVAAASIAPFDILVLTGLQPGETNVIVLDDSGAEIDNIALRVVEPGNTIVVRRGQERQVLQCDPTCALLDEPSLAAQTLRPNVPQDTEFSVAGEPAPPT